MTDRPQQSQRPQRLDLRAKPPKRKEMTNRSTDTRFCRRSRYVKPLYPPSHAFFANLQPRTQRALQKSVQQASFENTADTNILLTKKIAQG